MRLLNVKTLSFKVFYEPNIPPYVIASHRWTDDEASIKDVQKNRNVTSAGYQKVLNFSHFVTVKHPHIEWLWIDTVCIDQKSSTEVHEAVNSMFRWYQKAYLCLAYLSDVPDKPLENSQWFTRGWTLQELLAPRDFVFLDSDWKLLSPRSEVLSELEHATGIPADVLGGSSLRDIPVEQRVMWVQRRTTTRPEDMAYCLLGICDVYMSLIYGEAGNAWVRLAEEVSRKYGRPVVLSQPDALSDGGSTGAGTNIQSKPQRGGFGQRVSKPKTIKFELQPSEIQRAPFDERSSQLDRHGNSDRYDSKMSIPFPGLPEPKRYGGARTQSDRQRYGRSNQLELNRKGRFVRSDSERYDPSQQPSSAEKGATHKQPGLTRLGIPIIPAPRQPSSVERDAVPPPPRLGSPVNPAPRQRDAIPPLPRLGSPVNPAPRQPSSIVRDATYPLSRLTRFGIPVNPASSQLDFDHAPRSTISTSWENYYKPAQQAASLATRYATAAPAVPSGSGPARWPDSTTAKPSTSQNVKLRQFVSKRGLRVGMEQSSDDEDFTEMTLADYVSTPDGTRDGTGKTSHTQDIPALHEWTILTIGQTGT